MDTLSSRVLLIWLAISPLSLFCQLEKGTATVQGSVPIDYSRTVEIAFEDPLSGSVQMVQLVNEPEGDFEFVFDFFHPMDVRIRAGETILMVFMAPGDQIGVQLAYGEVGNQLIPSFTGDHAELNASIYAFQQAQVFHPSPPEPEGVSIKGFYELLAEQMDQTHQEIKVFASQNEVSPDFEPWMKLKQRYEIANFLINYRAYQVYQGLPRSDSLFDTELFPVQNPSALRVNVFGVHLFSYTSDRYLQRDSMVMALFEAGNPIAAYLRGLQLIHEQEPPGLIRELMIYQLCDQVLEQSPDALDAYLKAHPSAMDSVLLEELREKKARLMKASQLNFAPLDPLEEREQILIGEVYAQLLEASKEQVVYVDLWAVWCGPCRREIPDWIELYQELQGEGIAFWGLCCRSNRNNWLELIQSTSLPGEQRFLEPIQVDLLQKHFSFQGFPTYLILKDGKVVESQAERPSSGEIIKAQLRKYAGE